MWTIPSANKCSDMKTVIDVVVADKNLSTMYRGVKAAGLEIPLAKAGPFTIFAPSEIAFGKLPQGVLTDLLKPENKTKILALINTHIIEGQKNLVDLKDGDKLKTLNGKELTVAIVSGNVSINGAQVQGHDKEASNGVVHSLSSVLKMD
jgi:uncharacterized surface protein with fasciclin (FAS1) repeats